jgi:hypothetical protein
MMEPLCAAFLVAFFVFYLALFVVLLVWGIRGALPSRLKRARILKMPENFRARLSSPQPQRN